MSDNSTIFTGSSRFAGDFQGFIDRAVAIASLPLTQMQQTRLKLDDEAAALKTLDSKFSSLLSAVEGIETAMGEDSFDMFTSEGSVGKATKGEGIQEGLWTLEVTNFGSFTSVTSVAATPDPVTDPALESISDADSFTLTVEGSTGVSITPAAKTLNALVEAINARTEETGVRASVVNVASADDPDYRLTLQRTYLDNKSISFAAGETDLLDAASLDRGEPASYKLNGVTVAAAASRNLTIAPGLDVEILGTGTTDFEVTRSSNSIRDALTAFANAYNGIVTELDKHRGGTGALAGNGMVFTLAETARSVAEYSIGKAGLSSLGAMGLEFDELGKLSLDTTYFDAATKDKFSELVSFLGGAKTGGFLKTATTLINGVGDDDAGSLSLAIETAENSIDAQDDLIASNEARIEELRVSLTAQIVAADTLIASLEQQFLYISGMFQAMSEASKNYR